MSEAKEVESTRMVSVSLLETLTQIACDYINPNGERHHGIPPVSHADAHRAIKEAGNILDTNKLIDNFEIIFTRMTQSSKNPGKILRYLMRYHSIRMNIKI